MIKFPKPARRRHRRFATESLEERCLLSAYVGEFPLPSPTTADAVSSAFDAQALDESAERSASNGVEVLEFGLANNPGNSGYKISVAEIPEAVVLAVHSRLPGATIKKAETDVADGALLFEVRVELQGIKLDVVLSPDGEVLEIKQKLTGAALPDSLRDWIASNFSPESDFDAERVIANDSVKYELVIETPERRTFYAVLRLADGDSPRPLPTSDATIGHDPEQPSAADQVTTSTPSARAVSLAKVSPKEPQTAPHDDRPANNADDQSLWDAAAINAAADEKHSEHTDATRLAAAIDTSGTTAQVMNFLLTNTTMARVLTDVLPQDLAAIERGLREFLNGVNSLTDMTGEDSAARRWLLPLLTVAVALYVAEKFISGRKKSTRSPVLGAARQSSWSWVLNLSTSSNSQEK